MFNALFWQTLSLAVLDWAATVRNWRSIRWFSKPGTLIVLIVWFTQVGGWEGALFWFGLGLVFSLLGDILLHLPDRYFLPGIGAFFLAQSCYIAGFNALPLTLHWSAVIPLLLVVVVFSALLRTIAAAMRAKQDTRLLLPVTGYAIVLSLMCLSGISTLYRPAWQTTPAVLAALGASLFLASDAMIALNRFVKPAAGLNLWVMVTYHIGQILITSAALWQFAP